MFTLTVARADRITTEPQTILRPIFFAGVANCLTVAGVAAQESRNETFSDSACNSCNACQQGVSRLGGVSRLELDTSDEIYSEDAGSVMLVEINKHVSVSI